MRHHEDGRAGVRVQAGELFHERACVFRVERAGRFVRQHDLGVEDECARRCDALLLPAGHLRRELVEHIRHFQIVRKLCQPLAALGLGHTVQRQRQEDILAAGEVVDELKVLKQIADLLAAVVGQCLAVQRRDALAVQRDGAAGRRDDGRDAVEQRRFARAAAAHDAEKLARHDLKRDAVERAGQIRLLAVIFLQGCNFENGVHCMYLLCFLLPWYNTRREKSTYSG